MQLYTKILIGMVGGAVLGFLLGPNSSLLPADGVELATDAVVLRQPGGQPAPLARGLDQARILGERDGWLEIEWTLAARDLMRLKKARVPEAEGRPPDASVRGWVRDDPALVRRYAPFGRTLVDSTEWIGRLFLSLIKMIVVPLVFFSLVVGVASIGDFRKLGRIGGRTVGYFLVTTVAALFVGVTLANLVKPGTLLSEEDRATLLASYGGAVGTTVDRAAEAPSMMDQIVGIVPTNPARALADGDMLQVIFFALMLGIAFTLMEGDAVKRLVDDFASLNDAMIMLVHLVMKLAPYGVAALLFKVVGTTGVSVLGALAVYTLVVLAGLLIHVFVTYAVVIRLGVRLPLLAFLGAIKEALLVAFSTSSSSATLPVTMEACEDNLNTSREVTSFVLPLGATVNMDGTALYQGVAAIFISQIYGMDLGIGEQVTIIVSATLASVGAAGVPGAGMITLAMVLTAVGVPTEGLALILGVDRLLDMFRTTTNVVGDATATAFMARLEGENLRILSDAEDTANPTRGFERRLDRGPHPVRADDDA